MRRVNRLFQGDALIDHSEGWSRGEGRSEGWGVEVLRCRCLVVGEMEGDGALWSVEPSLHDALKDYDLVVVCARWHQRQGLDVWGHVLQVMAPPHRSGQVSPALQHTAGNISDETNNLLHQVSDVVDDLTSGVWIREYVTNVLLWNICTLTLEPNRRSVPDQKAHSQHLIRFGYSFIIM